MTKEQRGIWNKTEREAVLDTVADRLATDAARSPERGAEFLESPARYLEAIEQLRKVATDALNEMSEYIDDAHHDADGVEEMAAWSEMLGAIDAARRIIDSEDRAGVLLADSK